MVTLLMLCHTNIDNKGAMAESFRVSYNWLLSIIIYYKLIIIIEKEQTAGGKSAIHIGKLISN